MWRTTLGHHLVLQLCQISIHVLHVEDDFFSLMWSAAAFVFQSTSSMWRTTLILLLGRMVLLIFQSTSSMWRTTLGDPSALLSSKDFNPRPPCGGRPGFLQINSLVRGISIHVLHVEDDLVRSLLNMGFDGFQSTSSMWRTTGHHQIDTRPLRFQSTSSMWRTTLRPLLTIGLHIQFQSTSSMWRTTGKVKVASPGVAISIHVLHVEDDLGVSNF